jgi:hypothetical protein
VIAIDGNEARGRWREEYRAGSEAIMPVADLDPPRRGASTSDPSGWRVGSAREAGLIPSAAPGSLGSRRRAATFAHTLMLVGRPSDYASKRGCG